MKKTLLGIGTILVACSLALAIFFLFDDTVKTVPELHGKTDIRILDDLGSPDHESEFTMAEAIGEIRIGLFNTYPLDSPDIASIEIREWTWRYTFYTLTVWFHRPDGSWVVLDTCRYRNGTMF